MDESGSMYTDQAFIRDTALPRMAMNLYNQTLYGYTKVFVCSTGFTNYNGGAHTRSLGCSTYDDQGIINDSSAVAYTLTGGFEDGWHGIKTAIDTVPSIIEGIDLLSACHDLHRNVILVTDEDRDNFDQSLSNSIKTHIRDTGYVLNAVVNIGIDGSTNNFGMKIEAGGNNATIYRYDPSAPLGYSTSVRLGDYKSYVSSFGTTHADYSELVVGTGGAIWNINSLRRSNLASSFADVFVAVKVGLKQPCLNSCWNPPSPSSSKESDNVLSFLPSSHYLGSRDQPRASPYSCPYPFSH